MKSIANVSTFRTKGMKATGEQILSAMDGEVCEEQAEKLHIIDLTWIASNWASSIWNSWSCLPLKNTFLNLIPLWQCRVFNLLPQPVSFLKLEWICPCSPPRSILVPRTDLHHRTTRAPGARKSLESNSHQVLAGTVCLCAICTKLFPEVQNYYLSFKKHWGHKTAINAIARILLTAIYKWGWTALSHIVKSLFKKLSTFCSVRSIW